MDRQARCRFQPGTLAIALLAFGVTAHGQGAVESALTHSLSSSATANAGSALNHALSQSTTQLGNRVQRFASDPLRAGAPIGTAKRSVAGKVGARGVGSGSPAHGGVSVRGADAVPASKPDEKYKPFVTLTFDSKQQPKN
jgi:hypothetical protein